MADQSTVSATDVDILNDLREIEAVQADVALADNLALDMPLEYTDGAPLAIDTDVSEPAYAALEEAIALGEADLKRTQRLLNFVREIHLSLGILPFPLPAEVIPSDSIWTYQPPLIKASGDGYDAYGHVAFTLKLDPTMPWRERAMIIYHARKALSIPSLTRTVDPYTTAQPDGTQAAVIYSGVGTLPCISGKITFSLRGTDQTALAERCTLVLDGEETVTVTRKKWRTECR